MSNILKHADQIINERSEEKERQYGPFMECNQKAAEIASVITGKPLTALDVSWVQVAVKMARESNAHKEDNLLDMVATIGAINNELEDPKPLKAPGVVPTYFSTISEAVDFIRISPIEVHEIKHVLTEEGRRIAVYYSPKEDPGAIQSVLKEDPGAIQSVLKDQAMNTQDFKPFIKSWEEIYALQGELQLMYRPYLKERIANFDINTLEDQELFKKLCWQIVEELAEAKEAIDKEYDDEHFDEELTDAFNFMLELYQLYGMAPSFDWTLPDWAQVLEKGDYVGDMFALIGNIGMTANCLKNREWRQSQHLVDLVVFEDRLKWIWTSFVIMFEHLGLSEDRVKELWSLKYQVNLFRIKSKY